MLTSQNAGACILKAMENGAKLVYHFYYHGFDQYSSLVKVTLDHNGNSLVLSHFEDDPGGTPPFAEEGPRQHIVCGAADAVIQHPDIREGYAGYQDDYTRLWKRLYEHRNSSVPNWVTQQLYESY